MNPKKELIVAQCWTNDQGERCRIYHYDSEGRIMSQTPIENHYPITKLEELIVKEEFKETGLIQ